MATSQIPFALRPDSAPLPALSPPRSRWHNLHLWIISALLFVPWMIPFATHWFLPPEGLRPTGFIQPDMPYYVGNAREHFDDGGFHLLYGLPYSPYYTTPRIYFQPQTLAMGLVWRVTGMDPALLYLLFGAVSSICCIRLALAIFQRLFGLASGAQWAAAVGWIWGGGLLAAAGTVAWMRSGNLDDLMRFDPADGLWFLNFGRNFVYPHEAYYHLVFLGAVWCILDRRWWAALACVVLMAMSHPFTGVQLICIVLGWALLERMWIGNREMRWGSIAALGVLLALHLAYYKGVLNRSVEHREVEEQWIRSTQDWTYEIQHMLPAYAIVALLTYWTMRTAKRAGEVFASPVARLLAVWALVSFALANHEFFLRPNVQPLHFTRGYVWMPLYLLGAPALIAGFDWMLRRRRVWLGAIGVVICMLVLVTDNVVFLTTFHWRPNTRNNEMYIQPGFRELAKFLSRDEHRGSLLLTPDRAGVAFNHFPYLLTTYTPLRAWHSHPFNTPRMNQRHVEIVNLFVNGVFLQDWTKVRLLVILPGGTATPKWAVMRGATEVYSTPEFIVYRIEPAPTLPFSAPPQ